MATSIVRSQIIVFFCSLIFVLCAVSAPLPARGSDPFAPPSGISTTSATLQEVLAHAQAASGYAKPFASQVVTAHVTAWGLSGTYRFVQAGDDYKSTTDLGDISWQSGRQNGQRWRRNVNGLVISLTDTQGAQEADWEAALYARQPSHDLTLLGETGGNSPAYVVQRRLSNGRPEWFFYDKKTYLLTRMEIPHVQVRYTITRSDFAKSGPYTDARRVLVSDGIAQNDIIYTLSTKYNVAVTPADTAMPSSNDKLVQFPAGVNVVTLPATIVSKENTTKLVDVDTGTHDITQNGNMSTTYAVHESADPHIVVRTTIGGHGYDFLLDSGAGGIFISADAVSRLGLKSFGAVQQSPAGGWVHSYAQIPEMSVGQITMSNVIANVSPSFHMHPVPGTDVIGLVGYDFLANAEVTVDFDKGVLTAMNPFFFVPPPDATVVPLSLDNGVAEVAVQIGQSTAEHFIVDTGSAHCLIFPHFADGHADDVKDQGKGATLTGVSLPENMAVYAADPALQFVGGEAGLRATEIKTLTVYGISMQDWIMYTLVAPTGYAQEIGGDADGLLGYHFLKYFTVYFDYPQNQLFLAPNGLYRSASH